MAVRLASLLAPLVFFATSCISSPDSPSVSPRADCAATSPGLASPPPACSLTGKENLKIVVTDSGLGGLSVVADIARRAEETRRYREVTITFVNALFRPEAGYNSLATRGEKVEIFNNALQAMKQRYAPDVILVACNTLSVLLPECAAAQDQAIPVHGIVQTGVDLIEEELRKNSAATVLLFATQTTIEEDTHRRELLARGIPAERLVLQACPELTWYIEQDPEGFDTELMISTFVTEALNKRADTAGPVAISFNCTHFGYSTEVWRREVENQGAGLAATLNPNDRMAAFLFPDAAAGRFESPKISVQIVSMVEIPSRTVEALGPVVEKVSATAAAALREWRLVPDLFEWEDAITGSPKK